MISFQNLAAQLRSLCHGPVNTSRMAPAQVIDSEVTLLHTTPPCLMLPSLMAAGICWNNSVVSLRDGRQSQGWTVRLQMALEEAQQAEPWVSWAEAYAELLLRCAARWTRQCMGSQAAREVTDALPCIRLLLDSYFTKHMDEVCTGIHICRDPISSSINSGTQTSLEVGMWGQVNTGMPVLCLGPSGKVCPVRGLRLNIFVLSSI